jgi:formamidopyrimidine-DNA glycosylase
MPELPEVETIKRGLRRLIVGKKIVSVEKLNQKSFDVDKKLLDRCVDDGTIVSVHRRAKMLIVSLDSGYSLIIHLKMTGQLIYISDSQRFGAGHPNDSFINNLPDRSTRVIIFFDDKSKLFFNDQRKFGWIKLFKTDTIDSLDFIEKLGPEPLEKSFNSDVLFKQLQRRKKSVIKAAILDQTVLSGIGNIYADESLWGAKINPFERVGGISRNKINLLCKEIKAVLKLSIDNGGSTDRNYVDAEGKKGNYLKFARVFRREGQACPRCGTIIIKTRCAGRGTHICPNCQKI